MLIWVCVRVCLRACVRIFSSIRMIFLWTKHLLRCNSYVSLSRESDYPLYPHQFIIVFLSLQIVVVAYPTEKAWAAIAMQGARHGGVQRYDESCPRCMQALTKTHAYADSHSRAHVHARTHTHTRTRSAIWQLKYIRYLQCSAGNFLTPSYVRSSQAKWTK